METRITFEPDPPLFVVTTFGSIDRPGIEQMTHDVVAHPEWGHGHPLLIDHTASPAGHLDSDDLRAIAQTDIRLGPQVGPVRIALVLGSELDFGLGRMWEAFVAERVPYAARVFRDRDAARSWLVGPPPEPKSD